MPRRLWSGFSLTLYLGMGTSLWAHLCGPPDMTIRVGQTALYSIVADSGEPFHIDATVVQQPDPAVAKVDVSSVTDVLNAHFGIIGTGPGTTTVSFHWVNPFNGAAGVCNVAITVVAGSPGKSAANAPYSPSSDEPVNTATGEFFFAEPPDLYLAGPMPLFFQRYYASLLTEDGLSSIGLGHNWRHNFDFQLGISQDGNSAVINDDRGRTLGFQKSGATWSLVGPTFAPFQLTVAGTNYALADPSAGRIYTFITSGQLVSIRDRRGNTQNLSYTSGRLDRVDDGLGRSLTFSYDPNGYLVGVSDGVRTTGYSFDANNLVRFTDARGNATGFNYDLAASLPGLLTQKTLPGGNVPYTETYDSDGRVDSQTDADGNVWTFDYAPNQTTITDPVGNFVIQTHDAAGRMSAFTDENGKTMTMSYDSAGRRSSVTNRLGKVTSVTFDSLSGKLASYLEEDGAVTTLAYSSSISNGLTFRDLARVTYPDATVQSFINDSNGNLISLTDRAGKVTTYGVNARGQVLTVTNAAGGVTKYTYNPDGTLATVATPAGDLTGFGYDNLKRFTSVTNSDGTSRSYSYNASDEVTSVTDERGKTTKADYDATGNVSALTDATGKITQFNYDSMNRLVRITDPTGKFSSRTYDKLGRIRSVTDRNGNTGLFAYDGPGRLVSVTDAGGGIWQRGYDEEGNIANQTDPLGNRRSFSRDAAGRILQMTNPSSSVITETYDANGRQQSLRDPLGNTSRFSYDPRALLAGVALEGNIAFSFTRDELGAIREVIDPNGSIWRTTRDAQGRKSSTTDPVGNQTGFAYDSRNRHSLTTFPGAMGTASFSYDAAGNRTNESYSDGTVISYGYDDNNRLVSATGISLGYDARGELIQNNGLVVGRDSGGRVTSLTVAPGKTISYLYDSRDEVTNVTDWNGAVTKLGYDSAQRLVSITRSNGMVSVFSYSSDGFLLTVLDSRSGSPVGGVTVQRDAKGQIVSAIRDYPAQPSLPEKSLGLTFDAASQIVGCLYDGLGRLVNDSRRAYSWDLASRLKSYTEGGTTVSFGYDAFGLMQTRTSGGVTRQFIWNYAEGTPSIATVQEGGTDLRYYVRTPGGLLLYSIEAADNRRSYYHFDEVGNTAFLTDDSGSVTDSYACSPYGDSLARNGNSDNMFTFGGETGVIREGSSGLYYLRTRFYDATTSRFLTRDRLGRSVSPNEINPYSFARLSPTLFSDPWGRDARINKDSPDAVHTDISVDVWYGDRIIGVLTVSFARQAWGGKSGFTKALELPVLFTIGAQGEFSANFVVGKSIADTPANAASVVVHGTREQDERLAEAMLKSIGVYNGVGSPGLFLRRLVMSNRAEDGGKRSNLNLKPPLPTGDWATYRIVNRTCNTFTSAMLNVYFGKDVGTAVTAGGVMENLDKLQEPDLSEPYPIEPDDYGIMYDDY